MMTTDENVGTAIVDAIETVFAAPVAVALS